ncbi:MAG: response regulator transcription factor [Oscillospiraceae bacterium]|nr:response regulator transcription factor [Oscillospiraceae bacterium]
MLVIEEDKATAELLRKHFAQEKIETEIVVNGNEAMGHYARVLPDLIVLGLVFPGGDGCGLCKELRGQTNCPILVTSFKTDTFTKTLALEMGADDYIVKPFDIKELVARARALLRRWRVYRGEGQNKPSAVHYDQLTIDMVRQELQLCGQRVLLPRKELALLFLLATNPNQVFSRDQILDAVWGLEYYNNSRTVDVHIARLRKKLHGISPKWQLATRCGAGYQFITQV